MDPRATGKAGRVGTSLVDLVTEEARGDTLGIYIQRVLQQPGVVVVDCRRLQEALNLGDAEVGQHVAGGQRTDDPVVCKQ
eukprot:8600759-Pyramimonas_sp.AAC.1